MTSYTTTIGDFFEEATIRLFGGIRYQTQNDCDYCPDVKFSKNYYGETKASGRGGKIIIYEDRLDRELQWCADNNLRLDYVIWTHRIRIKECASQGDVFEALAVSTLSTIRVPIQVLREVTATFPVKVINRWNPRGWRNGWHIPVSRLLAYCSEAQHRNRLKVEGLFIKDFLIHLYQHQSPVI